ncbi:MAG: hypothetical protein GX963_06670 [Bacteroidales bacterium]|nr:hypothetical protein [Bacteroidales bacterium]
MNYLFLKIEQSDFDKISAPILFGSPKTDNIFATISKEDIIYKFSWQSELIDPVIKNKDENELLIGVDLNFIAFDIETGEILNQLSFDSFFLNIEQYDDIFYIITQLDIYRLGTSDFKIIDTYSLPDIFDTISASDSYIVVTTLGREQVLIPR